jgi:peptidylprolyl isomerase
LRIKGKINQATTYIMMNKQFTLIFSLIVLSALVSCRKPVRDIAKLEQVKLMDTITTKSGLQYAEIHVGTGATPKIGQRVTVHYTGVLENGVKFDSSVDRDEPFSFKIGVGQVIEGWDEGVLTMQQGGKRRLIIPSNLAYGPRGIAGAIPPNATLIFDVELLKISE